MSWWVDPDAPDQGAPDMPYAFIQWKGTNACFDLWCVCGAGLHYDGWHAYKLRCPECASLWEMPHYLPVRMTTLEPGETAKELQV